jgi:hypothetical protein
VDPVRRLAREERGQAAIELLLAFPFFLLIVLLVIEFGIIMYQFVSVSNAAREGARFGAVNCGAGECTQVEVCDRTMDRSSGILTVAGEISVGWTDRGGSASNRDKGDSVVVDINHGYNMLFFPITFSVVSSADMRLEQRDGNSGDPDLEAEGTACS